LNICCQKRAVAQQTKITSGWHALIAMGSREIASRLKIPTAGSSFDYSILATNNGVSILSGRLTEHTLSGEHL